MRSSKFANESASNLWQRLVWGARRVWQRADWPNFAGLDWEDRALAIEPTDDFHTKQGRSTCRVVFQANGKKLGVYLKRHYRLPWWRGWLATLFPSGGWSPAWQEWCHLQWAKKQGVSVPETAAVAEFIGPWGALQSFLAIEELAGMVRLHEAVALAAAQLDPKTFEYWKRGLIMELARLTRLLHDRRLFHKDLYLSHFFIPRNAIGRVDDWRGQVYLIDFHRLRHHPFTWPLWQAKDLGQLLYSSQLTAVTGRDRLRFWRAYLGNEGQGRWLRTLVLFKDWEYQRHYSRKKRRAAKSLRYKMNLKRVSFDEIPIRCEFHLETSGIGAGRYWYALIAKFAGHYREGSVGNPDAGFILGMARTAVEVWHAKALVLDFSELQYQWGDEMEWLLPPDVPVPTAVVVGPGCGPAIATLLWEDVKTSHKASEKDFIFDSVEDAWKYVCKNVNEHFEKLS